MDLNPKPRSFYETVDFPRGTFTPVECISVQPGSIYVKKYVYGSSGELMVDGFESLESVELKELRPLPPIGFRRLNLRDLYPGQKVNVLVRGRYIVGTVDGRRGGSILVKVHGGDGQAKPFSSHMLRPHSRFHRVTGFFSLV